MTASEQHVFLRFIKKHKAWSRFKKQLDVGRSLSDYINRVDPSQVLTSAFPWGKSQQGWNYWINLNNEFQKLK